MDIPLNWQHFGLYFMKKTLCMVGELHHLKVTSQYWFSTLYDVSQKSI